MNDLSLKIDPSGLRPLVEMAVEKVFERLGQAVITDGRLAYTEPEAASLLGLTARQLAEQRRAGRLGYSRGPKGSVLYTKADLLAYLSSRHEPA